MDRKIIHIQIRRTEGEKKRKVKSDRLTNREKVRDRGKQSNEKKTDISTNKQLKLNRERVYTYSFRYTTRRADRETDRETDKETVMKTDNKI
jgi:hypothetical protein